VWGRHYNGPDEQFLIIVDEAHRYRNEYTEDYAMLHNLCQGNKVVSILRFSTVLSVDFVGI